MEIEVDVEEETMPELGEEVLEEVPGLDEEVVSKLVTVTVSEVGWSEVGMVTEAVDVRVSVLVCEDVTISVCVTIEVIVEAAEED